MRKRSKTLTSMNLRMKRRRDDDDDDDDDNKGNELVRDRVGVNCEDNADQTNVTSSTDNTISSSLSPTDHITCDDRGWR